MKQVVGSVAVVVLLCLTAPTARAEQGPRSDRFGIFDVSANKRALAAVDELGIGWVRVQLPLGSRSGDRRLRSLSRAVARLSQMRIGLWLTLYHRVPDNIDDAGTVGFSRTKRGGFPPADMEVYRQTIRETVTRFSDAFRRNGRTPSAWLVIQFGNEVVPRDVAPPDKPVRFWHGTADQYLSMLTIGYQAVKSVDTQIPVAVAGISSGALDRILDGDGRVMGWYARMLTEGRYDWADIHIRHRISDIPAKMKWVRRYWNGPVAATEVAGPDPRTTNDIGDAAQAEDLLRRMRTSLRAGVRRLFWASLVENPSVREVHRHEGLIADDPWRKKPAYDAYRYLISGEPGANR